MTDLAIYGAGGMGREVYNLVRIINETLKEPIYRFVGFFDDSKARGSSFEYGTILGGIDEVNCWPTPLSIVLAFGSPLTLHKIASLIKNPVISFPNIIAPTVKIWSDDVNGMMGHGNIICNDCFLSCNVKLGNFNVLNGFLTVGHDAQIGDFNVFMAGVRISGKTTIGNKNLFGCNSFLIQGLKVGDDVTLAPCSSMFRKPRNGVTYIGVPANPIALPQR